MSKIKRLTPTDNQKHKHRVHYKYELDGNIFYFKHCKICNHLYKVKKPSDTDSKAFCSENCKKISRDLNKQNTLLKTRKAWNIKSEDEKKEIIKKREATFLKKYNVKNAMQIKEFKDKNIKNKDYDSLGKKLKLRQAKLQEKGIFHNLQTHVKNFQDLNKDFIIKKFSKDGEIKIKDRKKVMEYFNLKTNHMSNFINFAKKYDIPYEKHKFSGTSSIECELYDYFKETFKDLKIVKNARILHNEETGYFREIDIYFESLKIGIEYNGSYWHRDKSRDNWKKHKCKEHEIKLFVIWDYDNLELKKTEISRYISNLTSNNQKIV